MFTCCLTSRNYGSPVCIILHCLSLTESSLNRLIFWDLYFDVHFSQQNSRNTFFSIHSRFKHWEEGLQHQMGREVWHSTRSWHHSLDQKNHPGQAVDLKKILGGCTCGDTAGDTWADTAPKGTVAHGGTHAAGLEWLTGAVESKGNPTHWPPSPVLPIPSPRRWSMNCGEGTGGEQERKTGIWSENEVFFSKCLIVYLFINTRTSNQKFMLTGIKLKWNSPTWGWFWPTTGTAKEKVENY